MVPPDRTKPTSDLFGNAATISGAAAAALGVLGLLAWISGLRVLSSITTAYIPMAPDTAFIFVALGSTLILTARGAFPKRGRALPVVIVAFASVYGLLKFSEYFVKADLTFENILFPITDHLGSYPINRMSPITGMLFFLCGIALLSILWSRGSDRARNLAGGLGILVLLSGFVATIGYLFASPLLYGGDIIPLAPSTAVAYLVLGIGLVAAAGPDGILVRPLVGPSVRARMMRAFLPLTVTIVLLEGILQEVIASLTGVNDALLAAILSLIFIALTAAVVTQMARAISRAVDLAEVERERAEELLRQERNLLRTLIDNVPDQIFAKDTESKFILNNQMYARLKGTVPEALLGKTDYDFDPPDLAAKYQAEDQAIIQSGKGIVDREELVVAASGTKSCLLTTKVPLRNGQGQIIGVVGTKRDITGRKREEEDLRQSEQALKASEQYARNIIDSSLDMIITVDPERRIVEFNRAAETAFGYSREEVLGKNVSLLYANPGEGWSVHETTFEKGHLVKEILNRRKNGEIFPSLLSAAVMRDGEGELLGTVGVSRDITESRRAEEALRRRLAELGALHTVAIASVEAPDEDSLIERATRVVGENLFPDNFGILQLDPSRSALVIHPSYHADRAVKDVVVPVNQGITGQVAATGKAIRSGDVLSQPGYLQLEARIRSELCVPLRVGDRILGVINAESARPYAFTEADEQLTVTLASQLASAIDRLRAQAELRRLATVDELTCALNRRYFFELARREFDRSRRLRHSLSVIMLDIDHFKTVNDRYGHGVGDEVLKAVVGDCLKNIREIDLLGRYGGEEFTFLLVESDMSSAMPVAERLRASVAEHAIPTARGPVRVTVSLGVAQVQEDTKDITALVECADAAMYAAKAAGRNHVAAG